MHPIADFLTPYRRIDTSKWWTPYVSEWILAINPLHGIWDKWSPLRKHPQYTQVKSVFWEQFRGFEEGNKANLGYRTSVITDWWFWRWLAIDQLYHVLTNALVALLLGVL